MDVPRNPNTGDFPRRLQERLNELNWDRQTLAGKMNVTVATVGNWLRGSGFPKIGSRDRLCNLLGRSLEQLRLPPFDREG